MAENKDKKNIIERFKSRVSNTLGDSIGGYFAFTFIFWMISIIICMIVGIYHIDKIQVFNLTTMRLSNWLVVLLISLFFFPFFPLTLIPIAAIIFQCYRIKKFGSK